MVNGSGLIVGIGGLGIKEIMVHTNPSLPGKWTKYYQLPLAQRRSLSRAPHQDLNARLAKFRTRPIHSEKGMIIGEMPDQRLHEIATTRGWEHFLRTPEAYDPGLVVEFYASMMPPAFNEFHTVFVRGVLVRISMEDICRHYHVPRFADLDSTYGIPPIDGVRQNETHSPIIASALRRSGRGGWVPKKDLIKKVELRPEIGMFLRFIKHCLAPSTHYSDADPYVARILYCIQHDMPLDVGHIITLHMVDAASEKNNKGILPFPSLITKLCRDAGVRVGQTVPPPAPFDRTTFHAHMRAAEKFDREQAAGNEDSDDDEVDVADVDYNPDDDEGEEPEDPRVIARIDRLETTMMERMDRGFRELTSLIRGQPVPDEGAGPSDQRPARPPRRARRNRDE